jgi:hypothetical protein
MKLVKSLLLGGAAGLVAVAGASAADLAITKPAPAEYVRVCSSEGAGFFYIPGTETCLKIGGWVQMDVDFDDSGADDIFGNADDEFLFNFQPGVRLEFDARTQTSLGLLRSFAGLEVFENGGLGIDRAFVQLGGFIAGRADTFFGFDDPLPYTFGGGADLIGYSFTAGSGFYAGVAVEHPTGAGFVDGSNTIGSLVANVGYLNGGLRAQLSGQVGKFGGETDFGVNLQVQYAFGSGTTVFASASYLDNMIINAADSGITTRGVNGADAFALGLKVSQKFNDSFAGFIGVSYFDQDLGATDIDGFAVKGGFDYTVVPGFTVGPEVTYFDNDAADGFYGRLRIRRSF